MLVYLTRVITQARLTAVLITSEATACTVARASHLRTYTYCKITTEHLSAYSSVCYVCFYFNAIPSCSLICKRILFSLFLLSRNVSVSGLLWVWPACYRHLYPLLWISLRFLHGPRFFAWRLINHLWHFELDGLLPAFNRQGEFANRTYNRASFFL